MTVRLRAHHLLCLQTYVGKGYSEAFITNYDAIAERLSQGEPVRLVAGPDDICAPLLASCTHSPSAASSTVDANAGDSQAHCVRKSIIQRDDAARQELETILQRSLQPGETLTLDAAHLNKLRLAFKRGTIRRACVACQWHELCTRVANGGFTEARVDVKLIPST